jgi:mercuric ion transport protein
MGWKEHSMAELTQGRGALFAGGLAAILASTCCLGPLVLITLGFSGAWIANLTVLERYRPIIIGAALVALFWIVCALALIALGFPYFAPWFY